MTDTAIPGAGALETFNEKYIPEPNSGCWLWLGARKTGGYGAMQINGRTEIAHRASYRLHIGKIPEGLHCLHRCDTPICVNPDHLFLGTNLDNVADRVAKGRSVGSKGEKHGSAKLTEIQVIAIRKDKRTQREIAADYAVGVTMIALIQHRKNWTHIPEQEVSE